MKNNKELSKETSNRKRNVRRIGAVAALAVGGIVGGVVSQHDSEIKVQVADTSAEATSEIMPSAEKLALKLANDQSGWVEKGAIASNEDGRGIVSRSDVPVDTEPKDANTTTEIPDDNQFTYLVYNNKENARLVVKVTGRQVPGDPVIVEEGSIRDISITEQDLTKPVAATAVSPASYSETSRIDIDPYKGNFTIDFNNGQNKLNSTTQTGQSLDEAKELLQGYTDIADQTLNGPSPVPQSDDGLVN